MGAPDGTGLLIALQVILLQVYYPQDHVYIFAYQVMESGVYVILL